MAAARLQVALWLALGACAADRSDMVGSGSTSPAGGKGTPVAVTEDPCAGGQVNQLTTGAAPPPAEEARKTAPTAQPAADEPTVTGELDVAVVKRIVIKHRADIAACWDGKTAVHEVITFTIAPDGKVAKSEATGGGDKLDACVAAAFGKLVFPTQVGSVIVRYPMSFVPSDKPAQK